CVEIDPDALERLERVPQLQELALGVGAGAPCCGSQPGPADLNAEILLSRSAEAGAADRFAGRLQDGGEVRVAALLRRADAILEPVVEGRLARSRVHGPVLPDLGRPRRRWPAGAGGGGE